MPTILAWISEEQGKYIASWLSSETPDRPPATWAFPSYEHARLWVYYEAELLSAPVRWVNGQA